MPGLFWLAAVRAASVGIAPLVSSNDRKLPQLVIAPDAHKATGTAEARKGEKIVINVSGRRFEITRSELSTHPETLLGSDEIEYFHDDVNNEYFFERDPDLFRVILAFYRTGKLHFSKLECVSAFHDELAFFGISPEAVGSCCYEEYKEKSKELEEKVAEMKMPVAAGTDRKLSIREKVINYYSADVIISQCLLIRLLCWFHLNFADGNVLRNCSIYSSVETGFEIPFSMEF